MGHERSAVSRSSPVTCAAVPAGLVNDMRLLEARLWQWSCLSPAADVSTVRHAASVTLQPMIEVPVEPSRGCLEVDGRRLSYLDFGGPGRVLLALHGHFSEGRTFT